MESNQKLIELLASVSEPEPEDDTPSPKTEPALPEPALPEPAVTESVAPIPVNTPVIEPTLNVPSLLPELPPAQLTTTNEEQNQLSAGVKHLLNLFGESVDEIVKNQKLDRQQVNSAIQVVEKQIRDMLGSNSARGIGVFLEAWARMLQTKAEINANSSRSLDSTAKLLSALKSNDMIMNIGGIVGKSTLDLEALLSQSADDDNGDAS